MPQVEFHLVLAKKAYKDFEDIMAYTLEKWGERQVDEYSRMFKKTFQQLLNNPNIGHTRPDIPSGHKCLHAGRHMIFYKIDKELIHILRILHDQMDPYLHLEN